MDTMRSSRHCGVNPMEMLRRLAFWQKVYGPYAFFAYDADRDVGAAVEDYNPLTDKVTVRLSQTGRLAGYDTWSRAEWEKLAEQSSGTKH